MKIGILGLPSSGKTTLFSLLTEWYDEPDPSHPVNKPTVRSVKVVDERLERLRDDYQPKKYTPAALQFLDFPAMSSENSSGGMADLLAPARELETLIVVLRDYQSPGEEEPGPAADLQEVLGEFIIADLVVVENRLARLQERSNKPNFNDDDRREQELLGELRDHLESEKPVSSFSLEQEQRKAISGFGFLSLKPYLVVVNSGEGGSGVKAAELSEVTGTQALACKALNELEILQLPPEDQEVFLEEYAIESLSRESIISAAYSTAGRISFFTAGEKEVRAWTIRDGTEAVDAAGEIHSDIARGFIRAEVVSYDDYVACDGIKGAREKGLFRLEGKTYPMADGDVVEFRFSV